MTTCSNLTASTHTSSPSGTEMATGLRTIESVEMTDWDMYVEVLKDGRHSLPRLTPQCLHRPEVYPGIGEAPAARATPSSSIIPSR